MPPQDPIGAFRFFSDESRKKWADVPSTDPLRKHLKCFRDLLGSYGGETLREMIRLLVWDWEVIQSLKVGNSVVFFPPSASPRPSVQDFFRWHESLSTYVGRGVVDGDHRVSEYARRYVTTTEAETNPTRVLLDRLKTKQ